MATAFQNQLDQRVGEYLAATGLAKRGYRCTPLARNLPHFGTIAVGETGRVVPVQVRAECSSD